MPPAPCRSGSTCASRSVRSAGQVSGRMLTATGGVNTHRGALWALGLLAAGSRRPTTPLRPWLSRRTWRTCQTLPDIDHRPTVARRARPAALRRSGRRRRSTGRLSALVDHGLPTLRSCRQRGESTDAAALNALMAIMASLEDTCVLHRGGLRGPGFRAPLRRRRAGQRRVRNGSGATAGSSGSAAGPAGGVSPWAAARTCSRPRCFSTRSCRRKEADRHADTDYQFPADGRRASATHIGVVASGDLEVLLDEAPERMSPDVGYAPVSTASTPSGTRRSNGFSPIPRSRDAGSSTTSVRHRRRHSPAAPGRGSRNRGPGGCA